MAGFAGADADDVLHVEDKDLSVADVAGAAGAPKFGDKAAWAPRLGQGKDALYKSAIGGKGAMPPKGGAGDLSDGEIKAAVDHLIGLSK